MTQTPETQHALFVQAVQLLGGPREAARQIDVGERTMAGLVAGKRALHDGFLRDMAAALLRRADDCRTLEKQLNPLFSSNLVEGQPREDARRAAARCRAER